MFKSFLSRILPAVSLDVDYNNDHDDADDGDDGGDGGGGGDGGDGGGGGDGGDDGDEDGDAATSTTVTTPLSFATTTEDPASQELELFRWGSFSLYFVGTF